VTSWFTVRGTVHALPARRGDEDGTYLWIDAGQLHEALRGELYLPAVPASGLDGAMGVGLGEIETGGGATAEDVKVEFGRVDETGGVVSLSARGVEADVRFDLRRQPPSGGFCAQCGAELELGAVEVITPPDGGVIATPQARCAACGGV
jgi:hypothetical protein